VTITSFKYLFLLFNLDGIGVYPKWVILAAVLFILFFILGSCLALYRRNKNVYSNSTDLENESNEMVEFDLENGTMGLKLSTSSSFKSLSYPLGTGLSSSKGSIPNGSLISNETNITTTTTTTTPPPLPSRNQVPLSRESSHHSKSSLNSMKSIKKDKVQEIPKSLPLISSFENEKLPNIMNGSSPLISLKPTNSFKKYINQKQSNGHELLSTSNSNLIRKKSRKNNDKENKNDNKLEYRGHQNRQCNRNGNGDGDGNENDAGIHYRMNSARRPNVNRTPFSSSQSNNGKEIPREYGNDHNDYDMESDHDMNRKYQSQEEKEKDEDDVPLGLFVSNTTTSNSSTLDRIQSRSNRKKMLNS